MVRHHHRCVCTRGTGIDQCERVLRAARPTGVGATGMGVWAGVVDIVRHDGDCGLARLAQRWVRHKSNGIARLPRAIGVERLVELAVLWLAAWRTCLRGGIAAVDVHSGNADSVLADKTASGRFAGALSRVGQFCVGAKFCALA